MSGQGHVKYNIWENRTHATNVTIVTVQAGDLRRLVKTNISENLYDFASFQAGDLRGHMQSNIWENRGRLWWTESPPKSAQKSTRESSFLRRKVDNFYLCI